jgi:hypothetical protein
MLRMQAGSSFSPGPGNGRVRPASLCRECQGIFTMYNNDNIYPETGDFDLVRALCRRRGCLSQQS